MGADSAEQMKKHTGLTDVNTDQQNSGLQASLVYDRQTASRLGITPQMIDNTLYEAFGQAQVSTMYTPLNQYYVVMEVAPQFWQNPSCTQRYLCSVHQWQRSAAERDHALCAANGSAFGESPRPVSFRDGFFQSGAGVALSDAAAAIDQMETSMGMPAIDSRNVFGNVASLSSLRSPASRF